MNEACQQRKALHINAKILLLLPLWYSSSAAFKPELSHYRTPQEAVEYIAWQALREGRPPCVTVHPIGISLFCIMGQCIHDTNGKPHCLCHQSFAGLTCSIYKGMCVSESLCAPHLCKDNLAKISKFECICKPGYYVPNDPAFSHCIPENSLQSSEEVEANSSCAAVRQNEQSPIDQLDKNQSLYQPLRDNIQGRVEATPEAEKNASEVGVLCASSEFLMWFIKPKKENKTVDALLKKALQSAVARRKIVQDTKMATSDYGSAQYPETKQQLSVMSDNEDDDPDSNEGTSGDVEGLDVNTAEQEPLTYPDLKQLTVASVYINPNALYDLGQSPFIIQRKFSSTFRRQETGICDNLLLQADNARSAGKNAAKTITEKAKTNSAGREKNNTHKSSLSYKMNNKSAKKKSKPEGSARLKLFFHVGNKDEDDYEVAQFRMRALQKEKYGEGLYSAFNHPLPAAYFTSTEAKKAIEKSHLGNKPLPAEIQDKIIECLKHAVDVAENSKSTVANISPLTDTSTRLKNTVNLNKESGDGKSPSLDELHIRTVLNKKFLSPKVEETSASNISYIPSGAVGHESRQNNTNSRILSAEHFLSDRVGHKQVKKGISLQTKGIKGPGHFSFQNKLSLENARDNAIVVPHVVLKDAKDSFLNLSDNDKKAEYPSANSSTAVDGAEVDQSHNNTILKAQYDGLPGHGARRTNTTNKRTYELKQATPKLVGSGKPKHTGPKLFFNVTVLNQEGKNMSTAWYFVPAKGTKAILISWGVYNPDKT